MSPNSTIDPPSSAAAAAARRELLAESCVDGAATAVDDDNDDIWVGVLEHTHTHMHICQQLKSQKLHTGPQRPIRLV